jgi:predicted RNA-binding protein
MPVELREKIHLWEVLNQILKNNGYVDIEAVTTELTNLKNQINVLLSDVLGLEHEIDGVHNYDDTDLKSKIDGLNEKLDSFKNDVDSDVNRIIARITGINNTSSKISLHNLSNIEVSTMNGDNHGTRILLTPQQISIKNVSESPIPETNPIYYGSFNIGGAGTDDGVTIDSDNPIILNNRSGTHHLSVKSDKVEVSDINGLKLSFDSNKITIIDYTNTHVAYIP